MSTFRASKKFGPYCTRCGYKYAAHGAGLKCPIRMATGAPVRKKRR